MGKLSRLGNDLYEGNVSVEFVRRRWVWYTFSFLFLGLAAFGLLFNGLKLGVEFQGGVEFTINLPSDRVTQDTADEVRDIVAGTGIAGTDTPTATTSGDQAVRVRVGELEVSETLQIGELLVQQLGIEQHDISTQEVGASWGKQVVQRSVTGMIVFTILVMILIAVWFRDWKMSVGAIVALAHDMVITVGLYALFNFEVTPATVTGVLTILGYSLYDTVVVFDKVKENTQNMQGSRRTYAELANLAINQTIVRSVNTSIVGILPVAALLYIGAFTLGAGSLKDLSLALFIGMIAGTYSSITIATPLAVHLKEGEDAITEQDRRAKARARRDADRYANVPAFSEDMPLHERTGFAPDLDPELDGDGFDVEIDPQNLPEQMFRTPPRRTGSVPSPGAGRVVPERKAPVEDSGAAKRKQPKRQPRSKRGK